MNQYYKILCDYITQVLSVLLGCFVHRGVRHHSIVLECLNPFGSVLGLE